MANIMTPSFSQHDFFTEFKKQIGFRRSEGNPYSRVFAMVIYILSSFEVVLMQNSGSEAVELATRLTDIHAKLMVSFLFYMQF